MAQQTNKFIEHQKMCPFCKSEDHGMEEAIHNGRKLRLYTCSCGGKWEPRKPTEENLKRFKEWSEWIDNSLT